MAGEARAIAGFSRQGELVQQAREFIAGHVAPYPPIDGGKLVWVDIITFVNLKRFSEPRWKTARRCACYSAASDITDNGARASQPSRNAFNQARSVTSWTARSAKW